MIRKLVIIAGCLALAGCATKWAKPGATQESFAQDNARCDLISSGVGSGVYAQGNAQFVGSVLAANAIGNAIAQNRVYRDCMMMSGYQPVAQ